MSWQKLVGRAMVAEVDPAEARERQQAGALLIDVREPDEWLAGHPLGARHIPLGELAHHLSKLPHDREILFFCRTGRRSGIATDLARQAGLVRALNVRGGIVAWTRAQLPLER